MGRILVRSAVKREKGTLYYVDKAGNVCGATMKQFADNKNRSQGLDGVKKRKKSLAKKKTATKKRK